SALGWHPAARRPGCRFWALPLTFSVVLPLAGVVRPAGGALPVIDPAVRRVVQGADPRVVGERRLPGGLQPRGRPPPGDGGPAQRQGISQAQSSVLERLGGTDFVAIRRYQSVPFLALRVGPQALAALETMTDVVVRVRREGTVRSSTDPQTPSGPPGPSE